ncbi:MAG TPA: TRC40/GET3/ArsA family transport-energizing ATPase, partial [Longimicrobiaceae bacterium]|nr:TRC40/GET3/ArsA family transport-energizing ATPase [Longimicrobiaceae bacterium]
MSLARHLRLGGRWTFVGGKGGVGKTTIAAALAIDLADEGESVTLLSTDPAHSLGDALGMELGPEPRPVSGFRALQALEVGSEHERERFLREHRPSIASLLERGTYLDSADIAQVTGLTIPGMDEVAALLRLLRLADTAASRVILDTAPTGHTLRFLELPGQALHWIGALEAMEAKHAAIASALAGSYRPDEVAHFVAALRDDLVRASEMLANPEETRFVLVTTMEPVVLAESRRYADRLEALGIAIGGIVVNRQVGPPKSSAIGDRVVYVPDLEHLIGGVEGLRRAAAAADPSPDATAGGSPAPSGGTVSVGSPFHPPLDRRLYFVAGKGGVGKSTTAAALALRLADAGGGHILLLSVDPAGSLADVLGLEVGTQPERLAGVPGLAAEQLDAATTWAEFRAQYEREVESLFTGLTGSSLTATHDREVVERLLDLAPPGLD